MDNLPDWLKWVVIVGALFGTNGAQFLGFTAPAKKEYAAVENLCAGEMKAMRQELIDCWKERAKECSR